MNKLFSKIAALSVGLAMAIGVGVAVGSRSAMAVRAAEDDTHLFSDVAFSKSLNNGATLDDVTIDEQEYYVKTISVKVRYNKTAGGVGITPSIGGDALEEKVYNTSTSSGVYNDLEWEVSPAVKGEIVFSFENKCASGTGKGTFEFVSVTLTEGSGGGPVVTYTISYNSNGGSGTMSDSTGSNPSVAECTFTAPEGKQFQKWNTAANGSGADHAVGSKPKADLTLYAIWEDKPVGPITLNSSNWPVSAKSTHDDVQESTLDGIVYQNVRGYIYSSQLSLNYKIDAYFGNKTPYSRNIKSIVVTYTANVTSYVKMYEGDAPLAKTSQVTQSGTTTVTYTFSDTKPYFRLNMDTSTPKGTYCNITSMVINLGSATDVVDLEDISLNGNKTLPVGVTFASVLTLDPANANNKDTIAWSSSNSSVATVDNSGVVTTVGVGEATITATATDLVGVSASYVVSTFNATPIEKLYYMADGSAVDFNGVYVGTITGSGPVVMNGEYGILLYSTMDTSSYEEGTTILHVTGTLAIFSGLYEVKNPVVDILESAEDVADPVTYSVTGGETYIHENRRTYVSGTVTSVSGSWTSDTTVVMNVGGNSIQCFAKANSISAEDQAKIVADAVLTLKGFSGWHNGFQVTITGTVEESSTYTAEDFAQDLIDATDAVCVNYVDGESSYAEFKAALTTVWTNLQAEDKYQALPGDQKEALGEASREGSSIISQAMKRYDFLTGKYKLDNFITGRTPMSFAHTGFDNLTETNNTMIIVISIAAVSALAFTMLLVFKKKRQK